VKSHPDGYDRQVGEGGTLLSGGQRQSIVIARALLLDPKIYLFDEPTNYLDTSKVQYFLSEMKKEIKNKTFIVITHKPNILALVDKIIVMNAGKIVAYGPKEEIFKRLNQNQDQDQHQNQSQNQKQSQSQSPDQSQGQNPDHNQPRETS